MGFLDFLDLSNNAAKASEIPNLIKTSFEKFTDKKEYLGERIKSFISFIVLLFVVFAFILLIAFLIYKLVK